jgi:hypothetical protein
MLQPSNLSLLLGTTLVLFASTAGLALHAQNAETSLVSVLLLVFCLPALLAASLVTLLALLFSSQPALVELLSAASTPAASKAHDSIAAKVEDEEVASETSKDKDTKISSDSKKEDVEKKEEPVVRWKKVEQIWDDKMYDWVERKKAEEKEKTEDEGLLFKALHRSCELAALPVRKADR